MWIREGLFFGEAVFFAPRHVFIETLTPPYTAHKKLCVLWIDRRNNMGIDVVLYGVGYHLAWLGRERVSRHEASFRVSKTIFSASAVEARHRSIGK
jgi:hypothetical protein